MRILMINDHIYFGGGGDAVFRVERELYRQAGFETFTFSQGDQRTTSGSDTDFICRESSFWPLARAGKFLENPSVYWALKSVLKRIRPNLIRVHLVSKYPTAVYRALLEAGPVVQTLHGPNLFCPTSWGCVKKSGAECEMGAGFKCAAHGCVGWHTLPLHWSLHRRALALAQKTVRLFVCPSKHLEKSCLTFGLRAEHIRHPLDPAFCDSETAQHNGPPVVLFVGTLHPVKGVSVLLQAFRAIHKQVPGARLIFAGSGVLETQLREETRDYGLGEAVTFAGFVGERERLRELYLTAHVLVVPSIWKEQLGLIGPEALACGVPCVGSDIGGIPEWLKDGEWGFLVPPRDADAIANATVRLLKDRGLRQQFGERGRGFALKEYNPETYRDRLMNLVDRYAIPN